MVFNSKEKYDEELKKHAGHDLEDASDPEYAIIGKRCRDCNKTVQYGKLGDDSQMSSGRVDVS